MSCPYNCGEIEINKKLTPEQKIKVMEILGIKETGMNYIEDDRIEFGEFYDYDFEVTANELVEYLGKLGYILNGVVNRYGDYGEGRIEIDNNEVTYTDQEDYWRKDADDNSLIEELEKRGYTVVKKGEKNTGKVIYVDDNGNQEVLRDNVKYKDDVMFRSDYFATKLWSPEDIEMRLDDLGYEVTKENVEKVIKYGMSWWGLTDCTYDWEVIDTVIGDALGDPAK